MNDTFILEKSNMHTRSGIPFFVLLAMNPEARHPTLRATAFLASLVIASTSKDHLQDTSRLCKN